MTVLTVTESLNEKLDKLLAKPENQNNKGKIPAQPSKYSRQSLPDPVPVSDYAFYLLYL